MAGRFPCAEQKVGEASATLLNPVVIARPPVCPVPSAASASWRTGRCTSSSAAPPAPPAEALVGAPEQLSHNQVCFPPLCSLNHALQNVALPTALCC